MTARPNPIPCSQLVESCNAFLWAITSHVWLKQELVLMGWVQDLAGSMHMAILSFDLFMVVGWAGCNLSAACCEVGSCLPVRWAARCMSGIFIHEEDAEAEVQAKGHMRGSEPTSHQVGRS